MKRSIFFISVIVLLVFSADFAYSCSCAFRTTEEKFNEANNVFIGKVEDIRKPFFTMSTSDSVTVNFDVSKVLKGSISKEVTLETTVDEVSCGYNFIENEEYLVYTYDNEGILTTGICTGTKKFVDAKDEIEELNLVIVKNDEQKSPEATISELSQIFVLALVVLVIALLVIAELHFVRWIKGLRKK